MPMKASRPPPTIPSRIRPLNFSLTPETIPFLPFLKVSAERRPASPRSFALDPPAAGAIFRAR
jgi:hypothetical protein